MALIKCNHCERQISDKAKTCPGCGEAVEIIIDVKIKCNECGYDFSDKLQSCPECGCPIEVVEAKEKTNKTRFGFMSKIGGAISTASTSAAQGISQAAKSSADKISKTAVVVKEEVSTKASNIADSVSDVYGTAVTKIGEIDFKSNLQLVCSRIDFDNVIEKLQKKIDKENDKKKKGGLIAVVSVLNVLNNAKQKEWNTDAINAEIKLIFENVDFRIVWLVVQPIVALIPPFGPIIVGIIDFYLVFFYNKK